MTENERPPILLTGAHRSGSTWVAEMLAAGGECLVAQEPFNLDPWAYRLDGLAKYWFTYAPDLPEDAVIRAYRNVLDRRVGKVFMRRDPRRYFPFLRKGRWLIKDPIAAFSSEWLAQRFDMQVLVLVRHPAAFAASLKRLEWYFPFDHLLSQRRLMRDVLAPYANEIESRPNDLITQAAVLWKVIYHALLNYSKRNPGWIVRCHEDLSVDPVTEFERLYRELSLEWSPRARDAVERSTSSSNPADPRKGAVHTLRRDSRANVKRWRKVLSEEEIHRVKEITAPVAGHFYREESWS